jgi:hypothetical protein
MRRPTAAGNQPPPHGSARRCCLRESCYDAWEHNPLLRQIQRAAGLDPDGPRLVPMQAPLTREQAVQAAHRAAKVVVRDAMLCRAIGRRYRDR